MNKITIISAYSVSKTQAARIEKFFNLKHDDAQEYEYKIDKSVLGGLMIVDGDCIYDGTLKGQLNSIGKAL